MSTPPQVPFAPAAPGDLLLGRYRVERVLGEGGMGVVVAALHVELGQRVAVKFLHPSVLDNADAVARFTREARAAVRIKSDHVARVMDIGRLDNGAPYMVMEYLEGEDLAATLQRGPLPVEAAVDYLVQACDAMAEAHVEGIIHRDLKPANLFLVNRTDGSASVKVLDFGISKLVVPDLSDAALTRTATVMGSPLYMSPEQLKSARDVDARADVWSLGVILHELLAGKPPFHATTFAELVSSILNDPTPRVTTLRPDVPKAIEQAVQRCLEKSPERRFQNVGELAAAIVDFGSPRARVTTDRLLKVISASPSSPPSPTSPSTPPPKLESGVATAPGSAATATSWSGHPERDRKRRGYALAGAGLGLVGVLSWALASSMQSGPEATATTGGPSSSNVLSRPSAPVQPTLPEAVPSAPPAAIAAPLAEASATTSAKAPAPRPRVTRPIASASASAPTRKTLTIELK